MLVLCSVRVRSRKMPSSVLVVVSMLMGCWTALNAVVNVELKESGAMMRKSSI